MPAVQDVNQDQCLHHEVCDSSCMRQAPSELQGLQDEYCAAGIEATV